MPPVNDCVQFIKCARWFLLRFGLGRERMWSRPTQQQTPAKHENTYYIVELVLDNF